MATVIDKKKKKVRHGSCPALKELTVYYRKQIIMTKCDEYCKRNMPSNVVRYTERK